VEYNLNKEVLVKNNHLETENFAEPIKLKLLFFSKTEKLRSIQNQKSKSL
jgi:hypothetical protein